jgi:hypothetical protein
MGATATQAGQVLTPLFMGWVIMSIASARLTVKLGYRRLAITGSVLMTLGFIGLTLVGADSLVGVPQAVPRKVELTVVPAGRGRDLGSVQDRGTILEGLRTGAEVVVITAPPVDRSPEALLWAPLVDVIVLVVPLPGARRGEVNAAVEAMRLGNLQLAGTIVTDSPAGVLTVPAARRGSAPVAFEHRVVTDTMATRRMARGPVPRARASARTPE